MSCVPSPLRIFGGMFSLLSSRPVSVGGAGSFLTGVRGRSILCCTNNCAGSSNVASAFKGVKISASHARHTFASGDWYLSGLMTYRNTSKFNTTRRFPPLGCPCTTAGYTSPARERYSNKTFSLNASITIFTNVAARCCSCFCSGKMPISINSFQILWNSKRVPSGRRRLRCGEASSGKPSPRKPASLRLRFFLTRLGLKRLIAHVSHPPTRTLK